MSTELSTVAAALLPLNEDSSPDTFGEALFMLDAVAERVKELRDQWKAAAFERVQSHGPMMILHRKFYVAEPTETKCRDVGAALMAIMDAAAGDVDAATGCLSVNALKHGACKKLLSPEVYGQHFETTTKKRLGETAVKELKELDTRYMR